MRLLKLISIVLLCGILCFSLFLAAITNSISAAKKYNTLQERYFFLPDLDIFYNISNEFNLRKALLKRGDIASHDVISFSLSYQDLIHFRNYYQDSLENLIYLSDEGNDWRKAKVTLPGIGKVKGKLKIHGTSQTPIKLSLDNLDKATYKIRKSIFGIHDYPEDSIDITNGGFAFKLKLTNGNVYDGKSRLNLLSPHDDWSIVGNALNQFIASMGVITTYGSYYNLLVNGTDIGLYLGVENIDKSLLERNFQITNYGILKNYDDWDKAWGLAHIAPTMYSYQDMEQSGEPETEKIALFQLKRLFNAINNSDFETIANILDIQNVAKIGALMTLTGDAHPLHGDNARYIYDFSTGMFKLAYRIEGSPHNIKYKETAEEIQLVTNYQPHILIEKLASTRWFKEQMITYMVQILNNTEKILSLFEDELIKFKEVSSKSRHSQNSHIFQYYEDLDSINSNLKLIQKLVSNEFDFYKPLSSYKKDISHDYAKIFMTVVETENKHNILDILNDSLLTLVIKSITSCDGKKFEIEENTYLLPAVYDQNYGLISNETYKLKIPYSCISSAVVFNQKTSANLLSKDIYINYAKDFPITRMKGVDQFGSSMVHKFDKETGSESFTLLKGTYNLENQVIFPYDATVIFNPGVTLNLAKKVSLLIRGDFNAEGTQSLPIVIKNLGEDAFGTIAVKGSNLKPSNVNIANLYLGGGSEDIIEGTYYSSQLSIHMANVSLKNSTITNSVSDDGLNIKLASVMIVDNVLKDNAADQIDLDFVRGDVYGNTFDFTEDSTNKFTDGLDISGSVVNIHNNTFMHMTDKGISVGEKSKANIFNNLIKSNNIGIAIKDGSSVCLNNNDFIKNIDDTSLYIKKNMYDKPMLLTDIKLKKYQGIDASLYCNSDNFLSL